jgi:hypothetical protein
MLQNCNSVVIGETEEIWSNLLRDFANNQLKNIYKNDTTTDLKNVPATITEVFRNSLESFLSPTTSPYP